MRPVTRIAEGTPRELTRRAAIRLAGAAGLAAAAGAALSVAPASPAKASQNGWRWCRQCQGLWYAGNPTLGVCPARGTNGHSFVSSGDYTLPGALDIINNGDQDGWSWCNRCAGLWYEYSGVPGVCPAGPGGHDATGSENYGLYQNRPFGQPNWRWCHQCQGLWFSGNSTPGVCPAPGTAGHSYAGSGNYNLDAG
jgi:hypothetical protein